MLKSSTPLCTTTGLGVGRLASSSFLFWALNDGNFSIMKKSWLDEEKKTMFAVPLLSVYYKFSPFHIALNTI